MTDDPYAGWALIVVDAQQGFDDPSWGVRNNPACDDNIAALVDDWSSHDRPLVYVRHDGTEEDSPLTPGTPGNELRDYLGKAEPHLLVSKQVNSAFHGSPDLHAWLLGQQTAGIVVCGITTNHCCETTVRVGANLGHDVLFPIDATFCHDRRHPGRHHAVGRRAHPGDRGEPARRVRQRDHDRGESSPARPADRLTRGQTDAWRRDTPRPSTECPGRGASAPPVVGIP
jgi:nicotinamidase-related amidase